MSVDFSDSRVDVYKALKPALEITVKTRYNKPPSPAIINNSPNSIIVECLMSPLKLKDGQLVCHTIPLHPYFNAYADRFSEITFLAYLDYDLLCKIEKARNNMDLRLNLDLCYKKTGDAVQTSLPVDVYIAKSDWVEKLLRGFNLKDVMLIELPRLIGDPIIERIAQQLEDAHARLVGGDYTGVMVAIQKALEVTKGEYAEKYGIKTDNKIDFNKFLDGEIPRESADKIMTGLWSFLQSGGRHSGRSINYEDAEFAILTAYGLINLIIKSTTTS